MHGLTVYVKERRTSFCTRLISRKLCRFLLTFSTSFTSLSVTLLPLDEVLSVNPSPNVFVFGDINIHPLGKSDHVVSVSVDFPSNSQWDVPFHCVAYDYSCADWDSLCDNLRNVPREDIFKIGASVAPSEFCEWVQVRIDVYIHHRKYQAKPHSSPLFSASCVQLP